MFFNNNFELYKVLQYIHLDMIILFMKCDFLVIMYLYNGNIIKGFYSLISRVFRYFFENMYDGNNRLYCGFMLIFDLSICFYSKFLKGKVYKWITLSVFQVQGTQYMF